MRQFKTLFFLITITLLSTHLHCQENDDFSKRLKAINNQDIIFYNIDGVDFSSQTFSNDFSEKGLKKLFKKYSIKEQDAKAKNWSSFNNQGYFPSSWSKKYSFEEYSQESFRLVRRFRGRYQKRGN